MTEALHIARNAKTIQPLKVGCFVLSDPETIGAARQYILRRQAEAVAAHGLGALENPLSSTTVHEAGHAVVHVHFGDTVRYSKIWRLKRGPWRGQWVGLTMTDRNWTSDPTTLPDGDFRHACCQIAGLIAELMFDFGNFRQASSLDEIMAANFLAANVALKTQRDRDDIMLQVTRATVDILKQNAEIVREIARELDRHKVVRKKRLAPLLARVSSRPSVFELQGVRA